MDDQPRRRRRPHTAQPSGGQQTANAPAARDADPVAATTPPAGSIPAKNSPQRRPQARSSDSAPPQRRRRSAASPAKETRTPAPAQDELFWHPESALLDAKKDSDAAKKQKKTGLLGGILSLDAFICRIGDALLYALKWTGIGLVFVLSFVTGGAKKALSAISRLRGTKPAAKPGSTVHKGKRIPRKNGKRKPHPPQKATNRREEEVTIELTRPSDYHGMSDRRAGSARPRLHAASAANAAQKNPAADSAAARKGKRVVRAPGSKFSLAYSATMAALLCVALVSLYMIGSIVWRSISTKRLNNELSERYALLSAASEQAPEDTLDPAPLTTPTPGIDETDQEETPVPSATPIPTPTPVNLVHTTKFHQLGGNPLPEMEALYQENRDLVGWLRMEGILDLPVVYKDNDYYLTRDFYKNKSASGTLFLDENHPFRENAQNLLLHGHNMKDGTMFGRLVQYETNLQFLKNNPFIQYSTLWEKDQYVIFAVLHVSLDVHSDQFFNYFTHHTFSSDAQFENYVRQLQNRSVFSIPVNVEPTDALLTLSTCLDDDRLVIVARRVRKGESKSELRHQVQLAARQ